MKAGCQLSVVSCQKERAEREANGEKANRQKRAGLYSRSQEILLVLGARPLKAAPGCFIQWRVLGFREASLALRIRTSCSRTFARHVPGLCFSGIGNSTRDTLPRKWLRYIGLVAWPLQWKATIG